MTKITKRFKLQNGDNVKIILNTYLSKIGEQAPYLSSNDLKVLVNNKSAVNPKDYLYLDVDIRKLSNLHLSNIDSGVFCHFYSNSNSLSAC